MLVIGILFVVFCVGLLIHKYGDWDWHFAGTLIAFISGLVMLMCVITIPVSRMEDRARIASIVALRDTGLKARARDDGLEGAAYRMKIAEANEWIAKAKYYRGTIFRDWTVPEVETLEPIE